MDQENIDEAILAQQKDIESEIAAKQDYLVSQLVGLDGLTEQYSQDEEFLKRIQELQSCSKCMRRTRADGNCFYRAFGFALFEALCTDQTNFEKLRSKLEELKTQLTTSLGYQEFTVTDFHDTFIEELERVAGGSSGSGTEHLVSHIEQVFNDSGLSNYLVVYLRLITAAQMQIEQEIYINFLDGATSVKDFCSLEVEPMDKEADHVHIMALCSATGICVRVHCMERGHNSALTFPDDGQPVINLLYRPGHYDILYPGRSTDSAAAATVEAAAEAN